MTGSAPLSSLITSDFWGVPLSHTGSHKSYRPLTSLSFKLDWLLAPGSPSQFHLTNLLLHALVTHLFHTLLLSLLPSSSTALMAALLFAAHPIHTEAVAGLVGRAELLSALFFLLTLLAHRRHGWSVRASLLAAAATLAKEQGVTVLGICFVLELLGQGRGANKRSLLQICLSLVAILSLRAAALGGSLPSFSKADNPASHSDSFLTRALTFLHLPAQNVWLLLCPSKLSYDWSMNALPLVTSLSDPRSILSFMFYAVMASLSLPLLPLFQPLLPFFSQKQPFPAQPTHTGNHALALALALAILPFLPATNIFFYVGFVLAERLLYLPSLGFCLLVAIGLQKLSQLRPRIANIGFLLILVTGSLRTLTRNRDWSSEEQLFSSGVVTNPAKSLSNLGTVLHNQGKTELAEAAFRQALSHRTNMADTHYNLGILLQSERRLEEATVAYTAAIRFALPSPHFNQTFCLPRYLAQQSLLGQLFYNSSKAGNCSEETAVAQQKTIVILLFPRFRPRLAPAYLNLGLTYSEMGQKKAALDILTKGSNLSDTGLKDPAANAAARLAATFNLGKLLLEGGEVQKAISVLQDCWEKGKGAGAANLLGEAHERLGQTEQAEAWYSRSLQSNPAHIPAHLTLARMLARNQSRAGEAEAWFRKAQAVAPGEARVHSHYGLYLMDMARHSEASATLAEAARLAPRDYDTVFNAAVAAREAGDLAAAETWYRRAVNLRPQDPSPHMNLGALLHLAGRLREAEEEYLEACALGPVEETTKTNLQRLHKLMRNRNMKVRSIGGH